MADTRAQHSLAAGEVYRALASARSKDNPDLQANDASKAYLVRRQTHRGVFVVKLWLFLGVVHTIAYQFLDPDGKVAPDPGFTTGRGGPGVFCGSRISGGRGSASLGLARI